MFAPYAVTLHSIYFLSRSVWNSLNLGSQMKFITLLAEEYQVEYSKWEKLKIEVEMNISENQSVNCHRTKNQSVNCHRTKIIPLARNWDLDSVGALHMKALI